MTALNLLSPRRLKLLLLALPMATGLLYFGVFAADRYVSETRVGLRQSAGDLGRMTGTAALLAGVATPTLEDTLYLRDFLHSLALARRLDEKLGLRQHFAEPTRDPLMRLWASQTQEDFLDYFRSRVALSIDDQSSALTIRTEGFDAAYAQRLNAALLEEAERFVNDYSHRIARENLGFAETELARAAERVRKARADLLAFQTRHRLLDPAAQAVAAGTLAAELQAQIARAEAELRSLRAYLQDDAAQVRTLRAQIEGLQAQLAAERLRATGEDRKGERLSALAAEFQALQLQTEVALDAYKGALAAVEAARIESTRKLRSLVVIEPPTLPQSAEYPRRLYNLATLLLACLLTYGVVRLTLATIQEHQD